MDLAFLGKGAFCVCVGPCARRLRPGIERRTQDHEMSSEEDAAASVVVSFLPTGDAAQREAVHRVRGGRLDGGWQGLRIGYCRSSAAQHPRATRSMSSAAAGAP